MRLTALEVPTTTNTAKTVHPHCPSCRPGVAERVNDKAVEVWAQCRASSAKSRATATWAPALARLFSPRLRRWVTLIRSSAKPMRPKRKTVMITR